MAGFSQVGYRPHSVPAGTPNWVDDLELEGAQALGRMSPDASPLRVLVLYGSLRERSFSKFLAYEFARCAALGKGQAWEAAASLCMNQFASYGASKHLLGSEVSSSDGSNKH